jgi:diadenosine tetraphosphate (Ap4A) HIT family hydrolase
MTHAKALPGSVRRLALFLLVFAAGFACGGFSFVDTQARPLPSLKTCRVHCLSDPQVLGLLTSAGLHVAPGLMPDLIAKTERCVAVDSPEPEAKVDLVFFPLRDVNDLLEAGPEDAPYMLDCFALMRQLVAERHLFGWRVLSNGTDGRKIAYLHFHLLADKAGTP